MKNSLMSSVVSLTKLWALIILIAVGCSENTQENVPSTQIDQAKVESLASHSLDEMNPAQLDFYMKQYKELNHEELALYFQLLTEQDLKNAEKSNNSARVSDIQEVDRVQNLRSDILKSSLEIFGKGLNKLSAEQIDMLFNVRYLELSNASATVAAPCPEREYPQGPAINSNTGTVAWNAWNRVTMKGQDDCDYEYRFPARTPAAQFTASVKGTNARTRLLLSSMTQMARRQANGKTYLLLGATRVDLIVGNPSNLGMSILPTFQ